MKDVETIAASLVDGRVLVERPVVLDLDGYRVAIRSNSSALLQRLDSYFAHVRSHGGPADIEVLAIDRPVASLATEFTDWTREAGKTGRKDACHDLSDGRLVKKVRTGMIFLQSASQRIACGPCLTNDNQVINFVAAQYMNRLQQKGAVLCHAAGCCIDGRCLGIAGFSGGGKSTLMLHLLELAGAQFLTNDRMLLSDREGDVRAQGIPKLPRVNPGTIVSIPKLHPLLGEDRCTLLGALPLDELWRLDEKYDVDVEAFYGPNRIVTNAVAKAFVILNWQRDSSDSFSMDKVDLARRPELLRAVMKSPGPFFQFAHGGFLRDDTVLSSEPYAELLGRASVWEARGKVDFEAAARRCGDIMRTD